MDIAEVKRSVRAWLSGKPWLLERVFRLVGKPYGEIAIFRAIVRKGDVIFDIGANTGQYACLFCTLAGKEGSVHAFEPIPPTFAMLRKNTAHYVKRYELSLNNIAMGSAEGTIKMFVVDGRFTEASMISHSSTAATAEYECRVATVDRYIAENGIGQVDLIKCDVEGAELLAMKGSSELLKSKNPPILFLEAWSGWTKDFGYQPADLFEFLEKEAGYAIYHVYKEGIKKILPRETLPADCFPDFLNFLCIVPRVHGDRLRPLEKSGLVI
jgi:FkbM family methyltransferase